MQSGAVYAALIPSLYTMAACLNAASQMSRSGAIFAVCLDWRASIIRADVPDLRFCQLAGGLQM